MAVETRAAGPARGNGRRRLLDAALRRFDADGGLIAPLDVLREDAGLSVGALYHHFSDRRALATALYVEGLEDYGAGFMTTLREHPTARGGIEAAVRFHLGWCESHEQMARFLDRGRGLIDESALAAINAELVGGALKWYRAHAAEGSVRELGLDLIDPLWLGAANQLCRHWLAGRARQRPTSAADELAAAAFKALRSEKGT
jgi:AcrR family transcriptional regulator